ncbi:hypothetical protein SPFL3102_03517 [Sporomusaceae bacterium FL31]|nr:hypothetical protein SPFL3101_02390 [Sporomusaceae bacterium FL31]GCE35666.1 hypothetical protein SPFL3102_03517 [Sporomusaceae bacterium]
MDCKYPHWYQDEKMEPCCDYMEKDMCEYPGPKVHAFPDATFRDRLLCLLGDEILFSVDARLCGRESFCGTLCYVGCDFIIVNVCMHRKSLSMHIPVYMIRFFAPFKS